ncbi:Calcium-transporting ATPase 3 [Colletotrichum tanaceti]|uniref:Calcium-transporting ATPase 3 n=1 Tax=Colletotrichum tanaceti TaxID=1306861 RepID=A0A4U6X397_9PEZI|nr:Calcium-transporting ATPase 3 [Colletotrichum tanaceti]
MGQSSSDVSKDASDMVLTNDNFASIVAAIKEGRRIFNNIQKFMLHMLAKNIAQASTLLISLAFKDACRLLQACPQPNMGLGFERAVPDIMRRPPQSLRTSIFTAKCLVDMVVYGL